jgi:nucleosome-remodeling factor subunit BPTF
MVIRNPDGTTRIVNETTTQVPTKPDQPQKIQVMRGPDGKMSVRGLQANQKLVQTSDGKYLILPANHASEYHKRPVLSTRLSYSSLVHPAGNKVISTGAIRVPVSTATSSPVQQPPQKVLIRSVQPKTIISANNVVKMVRNLQC